MRGARERSENGKYFCFIRIRQERGGCSAGANANSTEGISRVLVSLNFYVFDVGLSKEGDESNRIR